MNKEEIEKIELERDFYNIMTNYGKLGYKINKTIDELNEISELSNLMAKEEKELKDRIQKAIEYIEEYSNILNSGMDNGAFYQYIGMSSQKLEELYDILKGGNNDK